MTGFYSHAHTGVICALVVRCFTIPRFYSHAHTGVIHLDSFSNAIYVFLLTRPYGRDQ